MLFDLLLYETKVFAKRILDEFIQTVAQHVVQKKNVAKSTTLVCIVIFMH